MSAGKTYIRLRAETNLNEVKAMMEEAQKHIEEASAIIAQLASEGISVDIVVDDNATELARITTE